MKELQQHIKPEVKLQSLRQVAKQKVLVDIMIPKPGMKCWEFNIKTGTIEEAKYESKDLVITNGIVNRIRQSITEKENCLYCIAINKNNAEKKFLKLFRVPKL